MLPVRCAISHCATRSTPTSSFSCHRPLNTDMNKLLTTAIVATCIALASSPTLASNQIGPYKIGMSNAQAVKFGLSDCVKNPNLPYINCKGVMPSLDRAYTLEVSFHSATKRIYSLTLTIPNGSILTEGLNIKTCELEGGQAEISAGLEFCYLPNNLRTIVDNPSYYTGRRKNDTYNPPRLVITLYGGEGTLSKFIHRKSVNAAKQRKSEEASARLKNGIL